MRRAVGVKLLCAALMALALVLVPSPYGALLAALTLLATCAFFAWAIVWPGAQFLVPSVHELPAAGSDALALTFDDGPDPVTTPRVLELLKQHGARATFFVVGARAVAHPDILRRIVAEGHAVGSHTFGHSNAFHFGAPRAQREEVERGISAVASVTGTRPRLFRPPQGLRTPLLRDALGPLRELVCVTWSARGLDTFGAPASAIVRRLEPALRPGAILTLHDGAGLGGTLDRSATVEALEVLLARASDKGLRCVSLADLESRA